MALQQLRNANFGKSKADATGSSGVGYTLYNISGSVISARTTTGVYQVTGGSGLYAAYISFPDEFRGQVVWDTGSAFSDVYYAIEQFNVEENNPLVRDTNSKINVMTGTLNIVNSTVSNISTIVTTMSASIETIRQFTEGRWVIDSSTNRMNFYDSDNTTLVASFSLYDATGSLNTDSVFERRRL